MPIVCLLEAGRIFLGGVPYGKQPHGVGFSTQNTLAVLGSVVLVPHCVFIIAYLAHLGIHIGNQHAANIGILCNAFIDQHPIVISQLIPLLVN